MKKLSLVELVMISQGLALLQSGYSKDLSQNREAMNEKGEKETLDLISRLTNLMIKIDGEIYDLKERMREGK